MIPTREKKAFWRKWMMVKLYHFLVQFFAYPVILIIVFGIDMLSDFSIDLNWKVYVALFFGQSCYIQGMFLRYVVGWRNNIYWLWLNDETDFGEQWWLEREGLKPGLWSAIRWGLRNIAWNALKTPSVPSHAEVYDIEVVKDTLDFSQMVGEIDIHELTHANKERKIYGEKEVYYRLKDGKTYGRYSKASPGKEVMKGVGNSRYLLRIKM